eukprot:8765695-Karenia_brevis.AAC.1
MDDSWQVVCWRRQPSEDGTHECMWTGPFFFSVGDANACMNQLYSLMEATEQLDDFLQDYDLDVCANQ